MTPDISTATDSRNSSTRFSKNCLFIVFPAVLILVLFHKVIFGGHLLWGSDFITAYLPYKEFLYEEIHKYGSIPFWNPYLFSGLPFWGFFESTIIYPLDALFLLIRPEKAYGYTMFLHLVLASGSSFLLASHFGMSRRASMVAAMVFSLNHFIIPLLSLGHMVLVQSYSWIPLVVLLFARAMDRGGALPSCILAGLVWGLQILAADPQTAFYTYCVLGLLTLAHYRAFGFPETIHGRAQSAPPRVCIRRRALGRPDPAGHHPRGVFNQRGLEKLPHGYPRILSPRRNHQLPHAPFLRIHNRRRPLARRHPLEHPRAQSLCQRSLRYTDFFRPVQGDGYE